MITTIFLSLIACAARRGEIRGDAALARGGLGRGLLRAGVLLELEALRRGRGRDEQAERGDAGGAKSCGQVIAVHRATLVDAAGADHRPSVLGAVRRVRVTAGR